MRQGGNNTKSFAFRTALAELRSNSISNSVTDLISAVVELLGRDMNRLVVEVREALELVEL
jgi:hypothetical protein